MPVTKNQLGSALGVIKAIADAIQELGSVPSGELYARLAGRMDIHTYEKVIQTLKGAGLVRESAHELFWIGRKF